jgi:hypothetical protein
VITPATAAYSSSSASDEATVARAVTSASGSLTCPVGQRLHVAVELNNAAPIQFHLSGSVRYTSPSTYRGYNYDYGVRGEAWRVDTAGGIATVSDYCTAATR